MQADKQVVSYQASSPDEVALVQWTHEVGLALSRRDLSSMQLRGPDGRLYNYNILQIFPFTSETKRMGVIMKVCWRFEIFYTDFYCFFVRIGPTNRRDCILLKRC